MIYSYRTISPCYSGPYRISNDNQNTTQLNSLTLMGDTDHLLSVCCPRSVIHRSDKIYWAGITFAIKVGYEGFVERINHVAVLCVNELCSLYYLHSFACALSKLCRKLNTNIAVNNSNNSISTFESKHTKSSNQRDMKLDRQTKFTRRITHASAAMQIISLKFVNKPYDRIPCIRHKSCAICEPQ